MEGSHTTSGVTTSGATGVSDWGGQDGQQLRRPHRTVAQAQHSAARVVGDRPQRLIDLVRQPGRHLAHGAEAQHVRQVGLVAARLFLGVLPGDRPDLHDPTISKLVIDRFRGAYLAGDDREQDHARHAEPDEHPRARDGAHRCQRQQREPALVQIQEDEPGEEHRGCDHGGQAPERALLLAIQTAVFDGDSSRQLELRDGLFHVAHR